MIHSQLRFCLALAGLAACFTSPLGATTLVLEATQLELPGGWETITTPRDASVHKYILAGPHSKDAPAAGAVEIPHAGQWHLWVRSKDYPADRPGIRHFTVRLGDKSSAMVFGRHGQAALDGWAWEDGGAFDLAAGPALVVIGDMATPSARCDALVFTDNPTYRPDGVPWKLEKAPAVLAPLTLSEKSRRTFLPEPLTGVKETPSATLENADVRFTFHEASTDSGPAIALRAATRAGDAWQPLDGGDVESYRVLFRPRDSDPKIVSTRIHPTWDIAFSPAVEATCGGANVRTRLGIATAPWA